MSGVNLPESEKRAIKEVDENRLRNLIDQAIQDESCGMLRGIHLSNCGTYIASELGAFHRSVAALREAKSAKNIESKRDYAERAGRNLLFAVSGMKTRVETEERDGRLFRVDDDVYWPHHFTSALSVRISFRWRNDEEDEWESGSITFAHEMPTPLPYAYSAPKRRLSAAKLAEQRQAQLEETWRHMMESARFSVRDFFREIGDGTLIPKTFRAIPDRSGGLNNFSLKFWKDEPTMPTAGGAKVVP